MEGEISNKFEGRLKLCREISVPESSYGEDNLENNNSVELKAEYDIGDPFSWPPIINNRLLELLVQKGPVTPQNMEFPKDNNGRPFSVSQYMRLLPNGEKVQRTWLIHSTKSNSVFCFCCKLFALKQNKLIDSQEFSDWRHLATRLSRHETSVEHMQICKKWYELKTRLDNNCTIDKDQQQYFESEK
jgi:hypothetical protein